MKLTDTHTHLYCEEFDPDRDDRCFRGYEPVIGKDAHRFLSFIRDHTQDPVIGSLSDMDRPQIDPVFQDPDESDLLRGRLQCHQPLCSQRLRRLGYRRLSQQGYISGGIQQGIRYRFRHL